MRGGASILPAALLFPAILIFGGFGATADTIHVCWDGSGDYLTIQEGIDAARDGDAVLVADGVYTGPGNKNLDVQGKAITVSSTGGPDYCVIDCEEDGYAFSFVSGEGRRSILLGLTLQNARTDYDGGAVQCWNDSSPTIINCVVTGNSARSGAGIYCLEGSPIILGCTITGNSAARSGGGVYYDGTGSPSISRCWIAGNSAVSNGGALYCRGSGGPSIVECVLADNTAGANGGGAYCHSAQTVMARCQVVNNSAGWYGGGIYWESWGSVADCTIDGNTTLFSGGGLYVRGNEPTITNCIVTRNAASGHGGGLCVESHSDPMIVNCLFCANEAEGNGAGISCRYDCTPSITNCTITRNIALQQGGGISCAWSCFVGVANCVIWDDDAPEGAEIAVLIEYHAADLVVAYSNVQGGAGGAYVGEGCALHWSEGNIDSDPLFAQPDVDDYRLLRCSPCIDAADNAAVPSDVADIDGDGDTSEPTPLDLSGDLRLVDDPYVPDTGYGTAPVVDMGAYEFPADCTGDLNGDRAVDLSDLGILLAAWANSTAGDIDCDGATDHTDLSILLAHWGEVCP